jgi:hypothetical protein
MAVVKRLEVDRCRELARLPTLKAADALVAAHPISMAAVVS